MALPYFYTEQVVNVDAIINVEEDTSRHIVQVLRMAAGEKLQLTDGGGNLFTAEISQVDKRSTRVKILSGIYYPQMARKIVIAISLLKNTARFEWFLEKATEIGVNEIIPLICERTEKHHFRIDRMKSILVSAMLQSQQAWLPKLSEPVPFSVKVPLFDFPQKFIAYCGEDNRPTLSDVSNKDKDACVLIGPEGDFSQKEIEMALQHHFIPVTLGETRLRTETAGIVSMSLLRNLS